MITELELVRPHSSFSASIRVVDTVKAPYRILFLVRMAQEIRPKFVFSHSIRASRSLRSNGDFNHSIKALPRPRHNAVLDPHWECCRMLKPNSVLNNSSRVLQEADTSYVFSPFIIIPQEAETKRWLQLHDQSAGGKWKNNVQSLNPRVLQVVIKQSSVPPSETFRN